MKHISPALIAFLAFVGFLVALAISIALFACGEGVQDTLSSETSSELTPPLNPPCIPLAPPPVVTLSVEPYLPSHSGPAAAYYIAIGDSISNGGTQPGFPVATSWALGGHVTAVNYGVIGETTDEMLAAIHNDLDLRAPKGAVPRILTLQGGTNDSLKLDAGTTNTVSNLSTYIEGAASRGFLVVFVTPPPPGVVPFGSAENYARLASEMMTMCRASHATACVDLSADTQLALMTSDGIHPIYPDGRQRYAAILAPIMRDILLDAGVPQ